MAPSFFMTERAAQVIADELERVRSGMIVRMRSEPDRSGEATRVTIEMDRPALDEASLRARLAELGPGHFGKVEEAP